MVPEPCLKIAGGIRIGDGHDLWRVLLDLLGQQIDVPVGRQGCHLIAAVERVDDPQGVGADGAGGAQNGDF